jgi:hypothetical protein
VRALAATLRRAAKPARKNSFLIQRARFAGQNDEDGLADFLGQVAVANLPQRNRKHQMDIARHQFCEGLLGPVRRKLPHKCDVVADHLFITFTPGIKGNKFFCSFLL